MFHGFGGEQDEPSRTASLLRHIGLSQRKTTPKSGLRFLGRGGISGLATSGARGGCRLPRKKYSSIRESRDGTESRTSWALADAQHLEVSS